MKTSSVELPEAAYMTDALSGSFGTSRASASGFARRLRMTGDVLGDDVEIPLFGLPLLESEP